MKKVFKDYFAVVSGTGVSRGLSFITSLILARLMGVPAFGLFSVFFTVMMLVWQIPCIIDVVYVRYAKVEAEEKRIEYLKTTVFMKGIIFILLVLLAYPASFLLAFNIFKKPEMLFYLFIAILSGAFLSLIYSLASMYQAQGRFRVFALLNLFFYAAVFSVILTFTLLKIKLNIHIVSYVYFMSAVLIGSLGIVYLYRITKPLFPVRMPILYNMLHFGKWLLAVGLVEIVLQRFDILFLTRFSTYHELGVYSAAVRVAMFAIILTSSSTVIFMPRGCESLKSTGHMKEYFRDSFSIASLLTVPIIALIIFTPMVIRIFFGHEYDSCLLPARILLLDSIFVLFYTPFSFLFYANGDSRQIFIFSLIKLAVIVAGLMLLVPLFGSTGAAVSIACASFTGLVLVIAFSSKIIKKQKEEPCSPLL